MKLTEAGRLAIRTETERIYGEEYEVVNAYWALPGTMQGAVWIAGIQKNLLDDGVDGPLFLGWVQSLQQVMEPLILEIYGRLPDNWIIRKAPDHERRG